MHKKRNLIFISIVFIAASYSVNLFGAAVALQPLLYQAKIKAIRRTYANMIGSSWIGGREAASYLGRLVKAHRYSDDKELAAFRCPPEVVVALEKVNQMAEPGNPYFRRITI